MKLGNSGKVGASELSLESWKSVKRLRVVDDIMVSNASKVELLMSLLSRSKPSVADEAIFQTVDVRRVQIFCTAMGRSIYEIISRKKRYIVIGEIAERKLFATRKVAIVDIGGIAGV